MDINRDYYLDFLRGLAVINVIIIHTAFKSGASYVPTFIQSITLLLDVPFFFFLAGWSYAYVRSSIKNMKGLIKLQKQYFFFLIIYTIILLIFTPKDVSSLNFIHNFFYINKINSALLPVVMGSIWFMPVYFSVSLIFPIIIDILSKKKDENLCFILLIICLLGFMYTQLGYNFFYISKNILFYGFFYVLGFASKNYKITSLKWLSIILILILILIQAFVHIFNVDIMVIQKLKFPPHIIYLLISMIAIVISLYIKDKIEIHRNNFIAKIGKNAIFYYFAQGISSSLLYFIVNKFNCQWYFKFLVFILFNIILAIFISDSIRKMYEILNNVINKQLYKYKNVIAIHIKDFSL